MRNALRNGTPRMLAKSQRCPRGERHCLPGKSGTLMFQLLLQYVLPSKNQLLATFKTFDLQKLYLLTTGCREFLCALFVLQEAEKSTVLCVQSSLCLTHIKSILDLRGWKLFGNLGGDANMALCSRSIARLSSNVIQPLRR
eukprot:219151-Amphidinium_carterae.1